MRCGDWKSYGEKIRSPRELGAPERHNRTTRLCGISRTYKMNKKRGDGRRYPCFSILIGPSRVISRSYTDVNEEVKLQEAIIIRASAIIRWPYYNAADARYTSLKFKLSMSGCLKCGSLQLYENSVEDGSPREHVVCLICGWRAYSPYPNEYAHLY